MNQTPKTVQEDTSKAIVDTLDNNQEQELLGKLIKQGVLELTPTLNKVGIHYAEAEKNWQNANPVQIRSTLEDLERKGALIPKFVDRVLTCPDCSSPEVYSKYSCQKCSSINVEYTELIEHMKCGHIGSKNNFIKGTSLICPGCQTELVDDTLQYRVIGNSYQCEKCGHRFDAPEIIHFCQQCKRSFSHRDAKYIKIYAYKIADEAINEFGKDLPLYETVEEILRENGYDTQFRAQIDGASGVQHPFDITAKKGEALLAIDVSLSGDKNDAVALLGKKMDVNPTQSILIDMSNREELAPLAKVYNITVLKGANEKDLRNELRNLLTSLTTTKKHRKNK